MTFKPQTENFIRLQNSVRIGLPARPSCFRIRYGLEIPIGCNFAFVGTTEAVIGDIEIYLIPVGV